jgi:hypothetical protein
MYQGTRAINNRDDLHNFVLSQDPPRGQFPPPSTLCNECPHKLIDHTFMGEVDQNEWALPP